MLCLIFNSASAQTSWCSADGAFGFSFGDRVPFLSTRVSGGNASTWYQVKPPKPDPNFDLYLVRLDTASSEIFEIVGHATVSPQHKRPPERFSATEREEGKSRAGEAISRIYEKLPVELRDKAVVDKHDPLRWQIRVAQDAGLQLDTSSPTEMTNWAWAASVSCKSVSRESKLARRVMPELFENQRPSAPPSPPPVSAGASQSSVPGTQSITCPNYSAVMQSASYPKEALKEKLYEGSVLIEFTLSGSEIRDPKVIRSSHPIFEAEAHRLVYALTCGPSTQPVQVRVPIRWAMEP